MENRYYVYGHLRRDNGKCFYIGKGTGNRAYALTQRGKEWQSVADYAGVDIVIYVNGISQEKALELESNFIEKIGIENLTNQIPGSNAIWTEVSIKNRLDKLPADIGNRISKGRKGINISEEGRRRLSESRRGKGNTNYNKGTIYKEVVTGFQGCLFDIIERFPRINLPSIKNSIKFNRPLKRGEFKGLQFIQI